MKYLKSFRINERVGVPSGLMDVSNVLYNNLISNLSSDLYTYELEEGGDDDKNYRFETNVHYIKINTIYLDNLINSFKLKSVTISIIIDEVDRGDDSIAPELTGAYLKSNIDIDKKNFKIDYNRVGYLELGIKIDSPWVGESDGEYWAKLITEIFELNKSDVLSSIAHELMHSYDHSVKKSVSLSKSVEYSAITSLRFGISAIDEFFYYLYYMTSTEVVVRSSEVAAHLDAQGVTYDNFIDFLKNNQTYKVLKDISNWSYEGFRNKLLDDVSNIRDILRKSDFDFDDLTDDLFIDELEILLLNNIIGSMCEGMGKILMVSNNPFQFLFEDEDDSELRDEFYDKFIEELKKDSKNIKNYFVKKEKMFKFESVRLIKKIYKLFDMIKDTKKSELHTKINNKKSKEVKSKEMKSESILNWDKYKDSMGVNPYISKKKYL